MTIELVENESVHSQHAKKINFDERSFDNLVRQISPTTYENLKLAVEIGKWPDGSPLSDRQKEDCMQLVLGYNLLHFKEEDRVGYIEKSCPSKEKEVCETNTHEHEADNTKIFCLNES